MRAPCRSKNRRTSSTATDAEWSGIRAAISGKSPLERNRQSDEARFAKRAHGVTVSSFSTVLRPVKHGGHSAAKSALQVKCNTLGGRRNIGETHVDDHRR